MKPQFLILPIVACLAACAPYRPPRAQVLDINDAPASFSVVSGEAGADDIGQFLAGLPVRSGATLSGLQQTPEYQAHRGGMDALERFSTSRLSLMRAWSDSELAPVVGGGGTVLYPFGGPDLLYVSALFPQARTYVLMGLEPVGDIPALETMPQEEVFAVLAAFRQATRDHLVAGYFVTKDMRSHLQRSFLRGVTPIFLSTVALAGGRVESISRFSAGGRPGVEMRYLDARGVSHSACYVEGDLSNAGFGGGYRQWLAGMGGEVTYFKAASYLMHDNRFSLAREFFLAQSRVILQDDSGIPFRFFTRDWSLRLFGNYVRPIELFAKHQQEDLRQAYAMNPTSPLGFGTGYHLNPWEGNLLLAIKR